MEQEFSCPVCGRRGLLPDRECCPQCDADLTCFQALDTLVIGSASSGTKDRIEHGRPNRFFGIAMFVFLFGIAMALVVLSFIMGNFDRRLAELNTTISTAIHDNVLQQDAGTISLALEKINKMQIESADAFRQAEKAMTATAVKTDRIASRIKVLDEGLDKRIAAVFSKEAGEQHVVHTPAAVKEMVTITHPDNTFLYHAGETDTLWSIAHRFYGDGKYYPVIMEQNPHLVISDINGESKVRLFSDPDPVTLAGIYREKTEWKNGMLLWKHDVQPGETRESIYASFSPPGASGQVFFDVDPKFFLNNTIRIILH
ncbi:MAG: hypothetical protein GQ559_11280 [Desulfobulbaceae bacterium]|nr:hypothetical protein [Desulfobulbaceae bacterium]